jgi:uncharacterized protein (TIGR00369 family)
MHVDILNQMSEDALPGLLGIEFIESDADHVVAHLPVRPDLFAPNGYLHAGTVVALADTVAGYGCVANLPEKAAGFTTVELKTNLVGTSRSGVIKATGRPIHKGKTTQVWTVLVESEDKPIAHFTCTQLILY